MTTPEFYEFEGFRLYPRLRALVGPDGAPVKLTGKAFDALNCFVEHPGELLERGELMRRLWPNVIVEENNLAQTVSALRRVLGEEMIATIPRRGYQFVGNVREEVAPAEDRAPRGKPERDPAARGGVKHRFGQAVMLALVLVVAFVVADLYFVDPGVRRGELPAVPAMPLSVSAASASPEARAWYERARAAIDRGASYFDDAVMQYWDQAIAADSGFSLAYLYRGIGHMLRARNALNPFVGDVTPESRQQLFQDEITKARQDARTAVRLDDGLAYGHALSGGVSHVLREYTLAQRSFDRALDLASMDPDVLAFISGFYLNESRAEDARALLSRLDGPSPVIDTRHAELNALAGRPEASRELLERYLGQRRDDINSRIHLAILYAIEDDPFSAERHLELAEELFRTADGASSVPDPVLTSGLVYGYGRIGSTTRARDLFDEFLAGADQPAPPGPALPELVWVLAYLGIGETQAALDWARIMAEDDLPPFVTPQLHFMLNSYQDPRLDTPPFLELRCDLGFRDETGQLPCP